MGSAQSESGTVMEPAISQRVYANLMEPKHIADVCELEQICFTVPWTEAAFQAELNNPLARYVVLVDRENPAKVIAYGGYWKILDEGHITNVAVRPEWRGQKAGTYLMQQMMQFAKAEGVTSMTLEVRSSNIAAQGLYHKLGFTDDGIRKSYYEDNGEDAIIMWYHQNEMEGMTQ